MDGCITIDGCTPNGKKQKARPRGVNLNARERNSQCDIGVTTAPSALNWCMQVVIDRRSDHLGKVFVCLHACTFRHRGRATRSIDHDTQDRTFVVCMYPNPRIKIKNSCRERCLSLCAEREMLMCVLLKRKKQKARPKGVNLKVRWRAKVAMRIQ